MTKKASSSTVDLKNSINSSTGTPSSNLSTQQNSDPLGKQIPLELFQVLFDQLNQKQVWENALKALDDLFEKENQKRNKKIKDQDEKIKDLKSNIQNSTTNSFAILSIFATVFIFISLNVNIFREITSANTAVFFIWVITCACCIIISVPILILFSLNGHNFENRKSIFRVFTVSVLFLLITWIFTFLNNFELKFKSIPDSKIENNLILGQ